MSGLKIFCQNCRQKLAVPPELIGSEIECPSCNYTVKVTKEIESRQPPGKVSLKTKTPPTPAASSVNVSPTQGATASSSSTLSPPPPRRKVINPVTKIIRNSTDDGDLHSFLPDKAMLGLSVLFILPGVAQGAMLGIPFLALTLITLVLLIFFNTLFFIKGVSWVCNRHVEQNPALITIIFTNGITSLISTLLDLAGIGPGLVFLLSFLIYTWIFELRLKEGVGKAMLISLIIIALNIVLMVVLGCVVGMFFAGIVMSR